MQAEELTFDDGSQRQVVEQLGQALPDIGVAVLATALVIEAVNLRDLSGLVVAS